MKRDRYGRYTTGLKGALDRFRRDERGQSLVLGVISVFMVLFFVSMILNVGEVTTRRIQLQVAADSAAYSSAALQAQMLNGISMVNTAIAEVRFRALRYAVDVNAYGVLAELRDQVMMSNDTADERIAQQISVYQSQLVATQQQLQEAQAQTPPDADLIEQLENQIITLQQQIQSLTTLRQSFHVAGDLSNPIIQPDPANVVEIVGMDGVDGLYAEAYENAGNWIPAANQWIQELSRLENTVAILAPRLAAETAYDVVGANGGRYASVFPTQRWKPRDRSYDAWTVEQLGDQWWRISHVTGSTVIEARREDCGVCNACQSCGTTNCESCWSFSVLDGPSSQLSYRLCDLGENQSGEHLWMVQNLMAGAGNDITCITQTRELVIVRWGPSGMQLIRHDEHDPPWLELVFEEGDWPENTVFIRQYEGAVQRATYQWENGQWQMPTEEDFEQISVNNLSLGGVDFSVNFDPVIQLPGNARIWVTTPAAFARSWRTEDGESGHIRITFTNPLAMSVTIAGMHLWVREEQFGIGRRGHTLMIGDADGIPRKYYDRAEEYWWQHQLTPTGAGQWLYEYEEFGALLQMERNMSRLMAFRDIERAGLDDPSHSEWSTPDAVPSWAYDPDANPSGWLNAWSGRLQPNDGTIGVTTDESRYMFYQQRPCWFCEDDAGNPTGTLEVGDTDGDGVTDYVDCPICEGKTYVVIGAEQAFDRYGRGTRTDPLPPMPGGETQRPHWQEAQLDANHLPLVLSEEWFKWGTTIGAWRSREQDFDDASGNPVNAGTLEYLLHDPEAGLKGILRPHETGEEGAEGAVAGSQGPVYYPEWGYFTVAAARCRLRNGSQAGSFLQQCRFELVEAREEWVAENMYNLYVIANNRAGGDGGHSYWDARLLSIDRQILTEDAILGQGEPAESGTAWLMELMARGAPYGWTDRFDGSGDARTRDMLMRRLRPRRRYGAYAGPYRDEAGAHRDPFVEQLIRQPQGERRLGGQLNYRQMDDENVRH